MGPTGDSDPIARAKGPRIDVTQFAQRPALYDSTKDLVKVDSLPA